MSYIGKCRNKRAAFVNTLRMEDLKEQTLPTKDMEGVRITQREAEEYRAYKKQQKIAEIMGALARSGAPVCWKDDIGKLLDRAARFHQKSVKGTPVALALCKEELRKSRVAFDCIVGGNGETTSNVKAYEARMAWRKGAKEITLVLSPSSIFGGKYGEIRKEIARVKRAAQRATLKVWLDKKYPFPMLARIARLCSELGVAYVCVPYFAGCERLRYDLFRTCGLEVSEVETLADFKKMAGAGVERTITSRVFDIYTEWMKEAEETEIGSSLKFV